MSMTFEYQLLGNFNNTTHSPTQLHANYYLYDFVYKMHLRIYQFLNRRESMDSKGIRVAVTMYELLTISYKKRYASIVVRIRVYVM